MEKPLLILVFLVMALAGTVTIYADTPTQLELAAQMESTLEPADECSGLEPDEAMNFPDCDQQAVAEEKVRRTDPPPEEDGVPQYIWVLLILFVVVLIASAM